MINKILELESKMLKNEHREDQEFLNLVLSEDFTEFGTSGNMYTKSDVLNSKDLNISIIKVSDLKSKLINTGSYLVTYIAFKDKKKTFRSSIWRIEKEEPKLFFHQSSTLIS
jgi:hypothetical protein